MISPLAAHRAGAATLCGCFPLHFFFNDNPGMFQPTCGTFQNTLCFTAYPCRTWHDLAPECDVCRYSRRELCGIPEIVFQIARAEPGATFFHAEPSVPNAGIVPLAPFTAFTKMPCFLYPPEFRFCQHVTPPVQTVKIPCFPFAGMKPVGITCLIGQCQHVEPLI